MTDDNKPVTVKIEAPNGTFVYDYELLTMDRVLQAETLFRLHEKLYQTMPATPDDIKQTVERQLLKAAYAAIFILINDKGEPEDFVPNSNPALILLQKLKGRDSEGRLYVDLLQECKDDFFVKRGIFSNESIQLLTSLTQGLGVTNPGLLISSLKQEIAAQETPEQSNDEQAGNS